MKYFVANWKANKNLDEALNWIEKISLKPSWSDRSKMVICPPTHLIYPLKAKLQKNESVSFGVQDISQFESGSYTGEITAKSLQGLVDFAIIGHSERRNLFNEDNEIIKKKVGMAKKYNIEPIFCIRDETDPVPDRVQIIAYEPVYAIGSGNNEPVEKVLEMKKRLRLSGQNSFLYGGSVDKNNASSYLESTEINGFLIGGASLNPSEFYDIVSLT